jgi:hypothetical protein
MDVSALDRSEKEVADQLVEFVKDVDDFAWMYSMCFLDVIIIVFATTCFAYSKLNKFVYKVIIICTKKNTKRLTGTCAHSKMLCTSKVS